MQPNPRPPFDQLEASHGVCVADGWGLKIHVSQGHLVIEDGIGRSRRIRRYHKATSGLARLVILGHSGYQTFEATRWLHDAKISVIHIDTDGTVLAATSQTIDNPGLRRAQALAADTRTGVEVTRYLLDLKVRGQGEVAACITGECSPAIETALDDIASADTLDQLRQAEMQAAVTYWQAWEPVQMNFIQADKKRIPDHWRTFGQRRSPQSASARRAVNPINSILNYLYALLEAEARIATLAVGLDPGLGILHLDKYARDSFALDLMEGARPQVDAYLLDLIEGHRFRHKDFHDTRMGGCRISKPLVHRLAETSVSWRVELAEPAEVTTQLLAGAPGSVVRTLQTPLTQSNRRRAKGSVWTRPQMPSIEIERACDRCGGSLDDRGKLCFQCREAFQESGEWSAAGRLSMAEMRARGEDPAHGGTSGIKRGESNRRHQIAVAEWNSAHEMSDPVEFTENILPHLTEISLSEMARATGLTKGYCSFIRRGQKVPHERHWEVLRQLATHQVVAESPVLANRKDVRPSSYGDG